VFIIFKHYFVKYVQCKYMSLSTHTCIFPFSLFIELNLVLL